MSRDFGQFFALRMTQPASSDMVVWSNIDEGGGEEEEERASDIPSFVFDTLGIIKFQLRKRNILPNWYVVEWC